MSNEMEDRPCHQQEAGAEFEFDEPFWDERYLSRHSLWSGNPNRNLVSEVAALPPGSALDVGCGEGADAIWLAQRGWHVTGVDLSAVALRRAGAHARQAGTEVAERIEWVHADVTTQESGSTRYDLVSAQYLHLASTARLNLLAHLTAVVAVNGTLLIVGHHPSDLGTTVPRPNLPDFLFTGDDIEATFESAEWVVVTNTASPWNTTDPEGLPVTVHDTVFRAQRIGQHPDRMD